MENSSDTAKEVLDVINERQQITYNELTDLMFSRGVPKNLMDGTLQSLEASKAIASRSNGGIMTYYVLQDMDSLRKVLIVEDDKNINKLMALSLGKGFEINQIYDGGEAVGFVKSQSPNLVILDLMLPHRDGLDICQTIKSDPVTSGTIIILVSAMDPTNNRFKGIKYGADYYIKKPFDPVELRSLVTLFLRKKGKRFDALVDLPDEERISGQIERSLKEGEKYTIGTLRIDNLAAYATRFGEKSAIVILRLISQLLQDVIKSKSPNAFVGFLNSDEFVIAGMKESVAATVGEVQQEFSNVLPFILQDEGYRQIDLNIDNLFESKEVPKLSLVYTETEKSALKERREEILSAKGASPSEIGTYTYDELQKLFGREDLDITITRDATGVRIRVGKHADDGDAQ
jgi:DNA-binding response OmpR family regulator